MGVLKEPLDLPQDKNFIRRIGRCLTFFLREIGRATLLFIRSIITIRYAFNRRALYEIVYQMFVMGIKSLGVVTVVAMFTGMVLALQTGLELRRFNQEVNIGTAVMVSMLREMGPFMTGLILSACVGSAIAAQIGTMVVSEEIDALEVMSIDPVRFLVMPRLVALILITPMLSFYTCITGVLGGGIVGYTQLNVAWDAYINNAFKFADVKDMWVGLLKAMLFGIIIAVVSSHEGFNTTKGAVGVGLSTRRAVIECYLLILIVGYFVTRIFYY